MPAPDPGTRIHQNASPKHEFLQFHSLFLVIGIDVVAVVVVLFGCLWGDRR